MKNGFPPSAARGGRQLENHPTMNAASVGHAIKIARLIEGHGSGVRTVRASCKGMKDFLGPRSIRSWHEFENTEGAGGVEVPGCVEGQAAVWAIQAVRGGE